MAATKKTNPKTSLLAQIEACKDRIAKERDKLRDLVSEADAIADDCDVAVGHLEDAADSLSKYL